MVSADPSVTPYTTMTDASKLMSARVTALLIDDHAVVREGYRRLLEDSGSIEVIGEASSVEEGYKQFCLLSPHVTIMDIALPELLLQRPEMRIKLLRLLRRAPLGRHLRNFANGRRRRLVVNARIVRHPHAKVPKSLSLAIIDQCILVHHNV